MREADGFRHGMLFLLVSFVLSLIIFSHWPNFHDFLSLSFPVVLMKQPSSPSAGQTCDLPVQWQWLACFSHMLEPIEPDCACLNYTEMFIDRSDCLLGFMSGSCWTWMPPCVGRLLSSCAAYWIWTQSDLRAEREMSSGSLETWKILYIVTRNSEFIQSCFGNIGGILDGFRFRFGFSWAALNLLPNGFII